MKHRWFCGEGGVFFFFFFFFFCAPLTYPLMWSVMKCSSILHSDMAFSWQTLETTFMSSSWLSPFHSLSACCHQNRHDCPCIIAFVVSFMCVLFPLWGFCLPSSCLFLPVDLFHCHAKGCLMLLAQTVEKGSSWHVCESCGSRCIVLYFTL